MGSGTDEAVRRAIRGGGMVTFLASSEASFMTGQSLNATGGFIMT